MLTAQIKMQALAVVFALVFGLQSVCAQGVPATPAFSNETVSWGIPDCGVSPLPAKVPSEIFGLAVGDYDRDGDDDLYLGCHGAPPFLLANELQSDGVTRLFVPNPDLITSPTVEEKEFDRHVGDFVDFDGDGDLDLSIITGAVSGQDEGFDQLFVNPLPTLSPAVWTNVAATLAIQDGVGSGRYPLWFDYDLDCDLDLFVGHTAYEETPLNNHNLLYQNPGTNQLTQAWPNKAMETGLDAGSSENTGTGLAFDWNLDGYSDLVLTPRLARHDEQNGQHEPFQNLRFYRNGGTGVGRLFERCECEATAELVTSNYVTVAAGNIDRDALPDLVFGQLQGPVVVWFNNGDPDPCLWEPKVELGTNTTDATALVLADFDNNGFLDLYVGRDNPDGAKPPVVLMDLKRKKNDTVRFSELTDTGVNAWTNPRFPQATWGDFDRDGRVDLVVGVEESAIGGDPKAALLLNRITQNRQTQNKSIELRLNFDKAGGKNLEGVGALVRVQAGGRVYYGQVMSGGSWHASLAHYLHFGVRLKETVNVEVLWPGVATPAQFLGLETGTCWELHYSTSEATACPVGNP